jgi:regulator of sigma E protease
LGMHLMATIDLAGILSMIGIILKVAVGLGAVIFVHELGHFLVAKACGVKVEKFMIGFDIGGYKVSWRRGETVYGIGILPLGGYVKMLGQDDDPAHIKEQMQKSQVDVHNDNAKAIKGPDGETYYVDRRSYLAKNVPQRMAIISAGVVMNVIFAFIFAVVAYGIGVPYEPAVVSEVVPGSAVFRANIRPGDEIVKIGKLNNPSFAQLRSSVMLGDLERGIECQVRRAADGKVEDVVLKPEQTTGHLATIGLVGPFSLTLTDSPLEIDSTPAARAKLIKPAAGQVRSDEAKLLERDEVIRVGDVPVKSYPEFAALLAGQPEKALEISVRRSPKTDDNAGVKTSDDKESANKRGETHELTFEVPPQQLRRFNFSMKMGPITSVRVGSPAAAAGIAAGDLIEQVDGKRLGEGPSAVETWDGETLSDYLRRAAIAGRDVELTLQRPPNDKGRPGSGVKIRVKPELPTLANLVIPRAPGTPLAANEIGIAYRIENEVALVAPNSPAAAAKIVAGDKITQANIVLPKDKDGKMPEPLVLKFVRDEPSWFGRLWRKIFGGEAVSRERYDWARLLDIVQFIPAGTEIELTVEHGDSAPRTVKLAPMVAENNFIAARGFWFKPIERIRKAESFGEQVRYGWDETSDALTMVFSFLKKIGGQVPISALGGPVTIAKAAGYSAAEGMSSLLIFLTMLSANLAVLNLLPIPLLDGGHLVFLAYEGIRGRPANEKFVVALHTIGFVFIVSLMLYVLALDLNLIPRNL